MERSTDRVSPRGRIVTMLATSVVIASVALATEAQAAGRLSAVRSGQMQVHPTSGPGGTRIQVRARDLPFTGICERLLEFTTAAEITILRRFPAPFTDSFRTVATIPADAVPGPGTLTVVNVVHGCFYQSTVASTPFTVIPNAQWLAYSPEADPSPARVKSREARTGRTRIRRPLDSAVGSVR
jgi:hypothetical protein